MTTLLLNAFSLGLLGDDQAARLHVRRLGLEEAREWAREAISYVGHDNTAAIFGVLLQRSVVVCRDRAFLAAGDRALVGQYIGPRLELGATALPPGAAIWWYGVDRGVEND